MAYLSNHGSVEFSIKAVGAGESVTATQIWGLKSLPDFGGGSIESIEVTTLHETKKRYIAGLADSVSELAYTFNFDPVEAKKIKDAEDKIQEVQVKLADGTIVKYNARISLTLNGASSGAVMEMTVNTTVDGDVTIELAKANRADVVGEKDALGK